VIAGAFRVGFMTLIGLVLAWTSALLLPAWSEKLWTAEQESYAAAFPVVAPMGLEPTTRVQAVLPVRLLRLTLGDSTRFPIAALIVNRRLDVAMRWSPIIALVLGASLATGLLFRERLRWGQSYASPSVSFLAKRSAECALFAFLLWSLSPLPLPYWGLYPVLGVLALGGMGYVANLPLRL
jgi:hypothetical protein